MSILLREYCGFSSEENIIDSNNINIKEAESSDYCTPLPNTLMVEIEGIHAYPYHTRNNTRYMPQCLKASEKEWTSPYLKPLIKHHNDKNGEIIGRIYNASYTENSSLKNVGALIFTVAIPDEKAANDVESRILETVSIGTEAHDVRCSICGSPITDIQEGCPEGHVRGQSYDNETCYWDIYSMTPKELSYVIVPSDMYAKNLRTYRIKDNSNNDSKTITESFINNDKAIKIKEDSNNDNKKKSDNGGNNSDMELEQKLKEAEEKIQALTDELAKKAEEAAEVEKLKAENEEMAKIIEEVKNLLEEKKNEAEKVTSELIARQEELETVTKEKEAAEAAGIEAEEKYHSAINDLYMIYRELTNKPKLEESAVKERPFERIIYSIEDMKEEYVAAKGLDNVLAIKESVIENPVPPQNEEPVKTKHQEIKTTNLNEQVEKLFMNLC